MNDTSVTLIAATALLAQRAIEDPTTLIERCKQRGRLFTVFVVAYLKNREGGDAIIADLIVALADYEWQERASKSTPGAS